MNIQEYIKEIKDTNEKIYFEPFNISDINNIEATKVNYLERKRDNDCCLLDQEELVSEEEEDMMNEEYLTFLTDSNRIHEMMKQLEYPKVLDSTPKE